MKIVTVPEGMEPLEFLKKFFDLEPETGETQQATATGEPNPDYVGEDEADFADNLSDPLVSIALSDLTELYAQRDQLARDLDNLVETSVCKDCANATAQNLRIFAWAGANFVEQTKGLPTPLKWDDMPKETRLALFEKAKAELKAFDLAQES